MLCSITQLKKNKKTISPKEGKIFQAKASFRQWITHNFMTCYTQKFTHYKNIHIWTWGTIATSLLMKLQRMLYSSQLASIIRSTIHFTVLLSRDGAIYKVAEVMHHLH